MPSTAKKKIFSERDELLNRVDALALKADLLANENRYEEALYYYNKALEIYPTNPDLWVFKAITLSGGLNRHEEAQKCWDRAKKLDHLVADAIGDQKTENDPVEPMDLSQFRDSCRDKIKKLMITDAEKKKKNY